MKSKFFLFLILITCFTKIVSESVIMLPCKKNIEIYKKKIARDYKTGKMIGYGVGGATIFALAYYTYKFFSAEEKKFNGKVLANKQLTQKLLHMEAKYSDQFEAGLFSLKWFKNVSKASFNSLLSTCIGYFVWGSVEKIYKKKICFDNLDSFINVRLSNMSSLYEFLYTSQIFNYNAKEGADLACKSKDRLFVAGKNLVNDIEQVISYMIYKLDFYSNKNLLLSKQELHMPIDMYESSGSFFKKINNALKNCEFDKISKMVDSFKDDIERYVDVFEDMERRIDWQLS